MFRLYYFSLKLINAAGNAVLSRAPGLILILIVEFFCKPFNFSGQPLQAFNLNAGQLLDKSAPGSTSVMFMALVLP